MLFTRSLSLLGVVTSVFAVPLLSPRLLGAAIVPPSQDPFYTAPSGYESEDPGAILRYRQVAVPTAIDLLEPGLCSAVWQLLYRSTDSQGQPSTGVTTIFVPTQGDSYKFFTQAIEYDSASNDCSPSYTLRTLTDTSADVVAIVLGLYNGLYVQSPDFESTRAGFTNGIESGYNLLDSLRASLQSTNFTGLQPTARIALNGGSGGALGCEWALEMQPTYAPEISIAGATLGSLTPNVPHVYQTINGGPFAGLAPGAIVGLGNTIPAFQEYLDANLVPSTAATFYKANSECNQDNQDRFALQNISDYFINPDWINDPVPAQTFQNVGIMGLHSTPQSPLYVYKGYSDEISSVDDTDALVEKYCAAGVDIVYVRDLVTGHVTESAIGFVGAYEYILDRLNGLPVTPGCVIINSTKSTFDNADATALGAIGVKAITALNNTLPTLLTD